MEHVSPFAIDFPVMPAIDGVEVATFATGMRYQNRDDLMVMRFAEDTTVAGVLTTNRMPGEPVKWCRKILPVGKASALVVNAGVANVFTGEEGYGDVEAMAKLTAELLGCDQQQVFIGSTGVIGEALDRPLVEQHLQHLTKVLGQGDWNDAAKAIMTTDTFAKGVTKTAYVGATEITLNGIVKGSGMIEPNMATMLGYMVTDAKIPAKILQAWLEDAVDQSYHSITVDSDTSTSDMVLCFATGQKDHWDVTDANDPAWNDFREKFVELHIELAKLVARDGEGITKFITIEVEGAVSDASARVIAKSVANSPLVKCAVAGEDPNWGRIAMAVGKAGEPVNQEKSRIFIGESLVAENSHLVDSYREEKVAEYMKNSEVTLKVDVGMGQGSATVWTMDLTYDYIRINVDYRS